MSIPGFRIRKEFQRPSTEILKLFEGIPSSTVNDVMNRLFCMRGLHALNQMPLLGSALTVKAPEGDNLAFHVALDLAQPGDVIVVDGGGCDSRALAGEIMVRYSEQCGIHGWVVDGALRDIDGLQRSNLAIYARGICPQGPYKNGPGEINYPISCGGQVVFPGDILVGDGDGIAVIRAEAAEEVAMLARKKLNDEAQTFAQFSAGTYDYAGHQVQFFREFQMRGGK